MDAVVAKAQSGELQGQVSALVQGLSYLPGWDEKNFQVMARQFEVLRVMAAAHGFTKKDGFVAINGIIDKVGQQSHIAGLMSVC